MSTFAYKVTKEQGYLDFLERNRHLRGLLRVDELLCAELADNGPYPNRELRVPGHVAFIYPVDLVPGLPRIEVVCRIQGRELFLRGARLKR